MNTVGNFTCECKEGYTGTYNNCADLNECSDIPFACPVHADCNNTVGSYECSCHDGYDAVGQECVDIDECADPS